MPSYEVAWRHANPHGVITAVQIPDSPDPVPDEILTRLPAAERELARSYRGYRQVQFTGGRLALRDACQQLGVRAPPLLADDRGAPTLPKGIVGSVSHKKTIAIAMAARDVAGTLGVDIEDYGPPRPTIASRVLTDPEKTAISDLDEARSWLALLLRFSIKESVYKAIDPYVRRYVDYKEATVTPALTGIASVQLDLTNGEGPFEVDARYAWLHGRLVTSVRIVPGG